MPNCEDCTGSTVLWLAATNQHVCLTCLVKKPIAQNCIIVLEKNTIKLKEPRKLSVRFKRIKSPPKIKEEKLPDLSHERKRARLYRLQDKRCYYCDRTIIFASWTIDHKIPLCRGGSNGQDNVVGACSSCNGSKSLLTEEEFKSTKDLKQIKLLVKAAHANLWTMRKQNAKPALQISILKPPA